MRWIIWYLKSCFCDHSWEYSEVVAKQQYMIQPVDTDGEKDEKIRSSVRCTKCGWHRSYWKYGSYAGVTAQSIQHSSTH
ncbi:hypothetical protein C4565_02420 [Candidatus Parcubacteria bacterium]|jgi:hypothetical protein|nr:MAG: hypothetical protein C4565_02420 [Candidatus Parcubacteria bacterium]